MARMGQPRACHRMKPQTVANTTKNKPARYTAREDIRPDAVTRTGPNRRRVSAPFRESMASLKKFVAIWMHRAPRSAASARRSSNARSSRQASAQPAHTGTMAAGRVFGREARKIERRVECTTAHG